MFDLGYTPTQEDRRLLFLNELSALTKKYSIEIGGCGCCGSPYLWDQTTGEFLQSDIAWDEGGYTNAD